jgi:hypothetical protein
MGKISGARKRKGAAAADITRAPPAHGLAEQATPFVMDLLDSAGKVAVDRVADAFSLTKFQLADILGLARETLYKPSRANAPKTQARMREMLEILSFVEDWAGGKLQALAWYRAQAIPEFGGRTAESLVKSGHASAVRDHLDRIALGGFA